MNNKKIASVIAVVLCVMMLASLVLSVIPVSAYADELDDLKSQKASLSSQVKECQQRLEQLKEQQANVLEQKAALDEVKDFMFVVTDKDGVSYALNFEKKPEGLADVSVGDSVTVTYTGELSEIDPFTGTILRVEPAK